MGTREIVIDKIILEMLSVCRKKPNVPWLVYGKLIGFHRQKLAYTGQEQNNNKTHHPTLFCFAGKTLE